jgi:hypothetical protein
MDGASKALVKVVLAFDCATDERLREQFATQAERDIDNVRVKRVAPAALEKPDSAVGAEAKTKWMPKWWHSNKHSRQAGPSSLSCAGLLPRAGRALWPISAPPSPKLGQTIDESTQ